MLQYLQLDTSLPACFPFLVSQESSKNLTRGALGNDIDEFNPPSQPLVPGLLLLDVSGDIPFDHGITLFQTDGIRLDNECLG